MVERSRAGRKGWRWRIGGEDERGDSLGQREDGQRLAREGELKEEELEKGRRWRWRWCWRWR